MSNFSSLFECFDSQIIREDQVSDPNSEVQQAELEKTRLEAYEAGYQSGWEDCAAAETEELSKIRAELARNLRDLGFTYHEARSSMLASLEPLLKDLFTVVLPAIVPQATTALVIEEIVELAGQAADVPVEVVVTPGEADTFRALLPDQLSMPVTVTEEPTLAEGQIYLRFGEMERKFDLNRIIERLVDALSATQSDKEQRNVG